MSYVYLQFRCTSSYSRGRGCTDLVIPVPDKYQSQSVYSVFQTHNYSCTSEYCLSRWISDKWRNIITSSLLLTPSPPAPVGRCMLSILLRLENGCALVPVVFAELSTLRLEPVDILCDSEDCFKREGERREGV